MTMIDRGVSEAAPVPMARASEAAWVTDALEEWTHPMTVVSLDDDPAPFGTCPQWCWYSPHDVAWDGDDTFHASPRCEVALELHQAELDRVGSRTYTLEVAFARLIQHHREIEPRVHIGTGDETLVRFTLDEFESFCRAGMALLEVGRKGRTDREADHHETHSS